MRLSRLGSPQTHDFGSLFIPVLALGDGGYIIPEFAGLLANDREVGREKLVEIPD